MTSKPHEDDQKKVANLHEKRLEKEDVENVIRGVLNVTDKKWAALSESSLDHKQEDARWYIGRVVFTTLAVSIGMFVFAGCLISAFGTESQIANLVNVIQSTGAILTPIVGFVGGYYFASSAKS